MGELIEALKGIQGDSSSRAFAKQLGVDNSSLIYIYQGKRRIGADILGAIVRTFPQLIPEVINYLKEA